ncbi:MAG: hypothetical protein Q9162_004283 [Coniocarpon cinnabarinum]
MAQYYGLPNRKHQTAALVRKQGDPVEIVHDHPIPTPSSNEVVARVLYTGVCQSDLHTAHGTASGADGQPITNIKLPHCGGHEGVARIIALGPNVKVLDADIAPGKLVGIRFAASVCGRCTHCLAGTEQYCSRLSNHLHHVDGSFQEFIKLDASYLTLLPEDCDPITTGPTLCAGVTAYKAVLNTGTKPGEWLAVVGAAGGLGHFAIQYATAFGARVIAIDAGASKERFVKELGASHYVDVTSTNPVNAVHAITGTGANAVVVTTGSSKAYYSAAELLRIGGTLSCCGIPPDQALIGTSAGVIAIKGLKVIGNLIGSLKECHDAVEFVRSGRVKPRVVVREFEELGKVYEELERGEVLGRVVLRVSKDVPKEQGSIRARL